MKPHPWSYSALNTFVTCPAQYHAVKILRTAADPPTPERKFGEYLHKQFELRQRDGTPLPPDLAQHEPTMQMLASWPGEKEFEARIALNRAGYPCTFFARDVWARGVLDYLSVDNDIAYVVDYKTGKRVPTADQLMLCALFVFAKHPAVQQCHGWYYMTRQSADSQPGWTKFLREDIPKLWAKFLPNLKQYVIIIMIWLLI